MAAPPHVALFFPSLRGGGVQRIMLNLAEELSDRGIRVDAVVPEAPDQSREEGPVGVRVVVLERNGSLAGLRQAAAAGAGDFFSMLAPIIRTLKFPQWFDRLPSLVRYLRRERPTVLLSGGNYINLVALWAQRLTSGAQKVVIGQHVHLTASLREAGQDKRRLQLPLIRKFYPWADEIIAVSNGVADDLSAVAGIPRHRIAIVHNPVVTTALLEQAQAPVDHPWIAHKDRPVLLAAGRFDPQKDFPTLVKAFARIRAARPARLILLGDGKQRREIMALIDRLDVAADVALPGFVTNPFKYMSHADVLVLSSVFEGLPTVLIEAMACGCPVVSTDCPSGPREILDDGVYGPLTPVRDDVALATAILSLLDAPPDPQRLRQRAALFRVDCVIDQYLDVLGIAPPKTMSMTCGRPL